MPQSCDHDGWDVWEVIPAQATFGVSLVTVGDGGFADAIGGRSGVVGDILNG